MKQILVLYILTFFVFTSVFSQKLDSTLNKNKKKRVNFAAIPIISYNNSFGAQAGLMTNMYYNVNAKDTISPSSVVGVTGTYFINGTYFLGMFGKELF